MYVIRYAITELDPYIFKSFSIDLTLSLDIYTFSEFLFLVFLSLTS